MVKGITEKFSAFHHPFRRRFASGFFGVWALLAQGIPSPVFAKESHSTTLAYDIFRNGETVGTYVFDIVEDGGARTVRAAMQIEIRLLQVPIYKASHERRDIWAGDSLLSLKGQSRYNGKSYEMEVTRRGGARLLTVNGVTEKLDAPCFPFVPWLPEGQASMLLLTEKGRLMQVSISDIGSETRNVGGDEMRLHHYVYRGDWERHAWYDKNGSLAMMTYDLNGAQIRIVRRGDR